MTALVRESGVPVNVRVPFAKGGFLSPNEASEGIFLEDSAHDLGRWPTPSMLAIERVARHPNAWAEGLMKARPDPPLKVISLYYPLGLNRYAEKHS